MSALEKELHPLDIALNYCINGKPDLSEEILRAQGPDDPRARFNLGWHDMRHGELKKGLDGMNIGRYIEVFGSKPIPGPIPRPEEDITGKTVLFRSEGGFGDEIINFRFAKYYKERGAVVTVACQPSLASLFAREGYSIVTNKAAEQGGAFYNYWVPAMSAAYCLDMEYEDLSGAPYITKPEVKKGNKFRIGLKWSGNPQFEHEQHRVFPHQQMFDAVGGLDVEYVSLQRDEGKEFRPDWAKEVCLDAWVNTAEEIAKCDLVISSCTSIAHCAAAMGVKTWIITPVMPYYLWAMPGDTSPWYDSVRLFRQEKYSEWDAPFAKLKVELAKEVEHANN
jgi:hypothetical protein